MKLILVFLLFFMRIPAKSQDVDSATPGIYTNSDLCLVTNARELFSSGRYSMSGYVYEFFPTNRFEKNYRDCYGERLLQTGHFEMSSAGNLTTVSSDAHQVFKVYRFEKHLILIEVSKEDEFLQLFQKFCSISNKSKSPFVQVEYPEFTRSYVIAFMISDKFPVTFD